jgi:type II secretory pathway component PulF
MVRVGETGGILDKTMKQLIGLIARDESIKSSMKNAAAYPLFVLGVGLVSVIIVLTKVLPSIVNSMDVPILPLPTQMLMDTSDFLVAYGWLVAIVLGFAVFGFAKWKRTAKGRLMLDGFKLRIPILGPVLKTIAVGRFARTLGALTECGITILYALAVVRDTLGNEVLGRAIDDVSSRVKAGEPLADPLAESGMFPPLLVQIVSIGEQTGKLDELLLNAADTFDDEADQAVTRFMAVFPALLILLLALVVGFIIAATLLPILGMSMGGAV